MGKWGSSRRHSSSWAHVSERAFYRVRNSSVFSPCATRFPRSCCRSGCSLPLRRFSCCWGRSTADTAAPSRRSSPAGTDGCGGGSRCSPSSPARGCSRGWTHCCPPSRRCSRLRGFLSCCSFCERAREGSRCSTAFWCPCSSRSCSPMRAAGRSAPTFPREGAWGCCMRG